MSWDPLGTLPEHFIAHAAMGVTSGGGGGGISGGGTTNRVAKFTGATAIGDSSITDIGTRINVPSGTVMVVGSAGAPFDPLNAMEFSTPGDTHFGVFTRSTTGSASSTGDTGAAFVLGHPLVADVNDERPAWFFQAIQPNDNDAAASYLRMGWLKYDNAGGVVGAVPDALTFRTDGASATLQPQTIDMQGVYFITGVVSPPLNASDAVPKSYVDGIQKNYTVMSLASDTTVLGSVVAETTLISSIIGSATIPGGIVGSGDSVEVIAEGYYNTDADATAAQIRFKLKYGAVTVLDTGAQALPISAGNRKWSFHGITTSRAAFPGNLAMTQGKILINLDPSTNYGIPNMWGMENTGAAGVNNTSQTINFGSNQTMDFTVTWSGAGSDAGDSVTCTHIQMTIRNVQ